MAVCLVTGGAGFIGSNLVDALVARGDTVRVLDDFSTGRPENLDAVRGKVEVLRGDITEPEMVRTAVRGMEVVFHQAALASVPRSIANPIATHRVCVDGTVNVLVAARDAGVRRVVYAASSSAYGNSKRLPKRETDPTAPRSPYAVAKLAGEHYCKAFTEVYGLETVRLRYFNVYGPRQSPDSAYAAVIPLFIQALSEGRSPYIHGDGEQSRDFTFVADVVRANLLAAEAPGVAGQVYNVACGQRTSLRQLAAYLNELIGVEIAPEHGPDRAGDVKHSLADIEAARTDLEYQPTNDMRSGLKRTLEWWTRQRGLRLRVAA
jgi:UDP-glucose 4-epimerase